MKILVLSRGCPSEEYPMNGIFEMDQAKALAKLGHDVIYFAIDRRSFRRKRKFGISYKEQSGVKIYEYNFPLGRAPQSILDIIGFKMFQTLYNIVLKDHWTPDIIYAHFVRFTGYIAYNAYKKYNIPYAIMEHDSIINKNKISDNYRNKVKTIYNSAKVRFAVSPTFVENLFKIYNLNFKFIPNIIELDTFYNVKKKEHEGINVVSVGNLIFGKGMDITIKAFNAAKNSCNLNKLYIVGDGVEKNKLNNLAKEYGLQDKVILMGTLNRQEIAKLYETMDIFVLSSKSETFGVAYLEALCAGIPIVATRCGGPEGLYTKEQCIYVDIDDVEQIKDAIVYIASHIHEYNPTKLKKICRDSFSGEVVANKIVDYIIKK